MKKWVNITGIVTAIVLAILGVAWGGVSGAYREYRFVVAQAYAYSADQAQAKQNQQILQQIARDVADIKRDAATMVGRAKVLTDGAAEVVMLINESSKAILYLKHGRARVTNLSSEDTPTITVKVGGTFRNTQEDILVMLSHKAADMLGITEGQTVKIRLEPMPE